MPRVLLYVFGIAHGTPVAVSARQMRKSSKKMHYCIGPLIGTPLDVETFATSDFGWTQGLSYQEYKRRPAVISSLVHEESEGA